MKSSFYIFCICISVSVIFSCGNDDEIVFIDCSPSVTEPINNPQDSLIFDCSGQGVILDNDLPEYFSPQFHPNNPNKIIFTKEVIIPGVIISECSKYELYEFDFCTTGKTLLYPNRLCKNLDWGIEDKILFITDDILSTIEYDDGTINELIDNSLTPNANLIIQTFR